MTGYGLSLDFFRDLQRAMGVACMYFMQLMEVCFRKTENKNKQGKKSYMVP